ARNRKLSQLNQLTIPRRTTRTCGALLTHSKLGSHPRLHLVRRNILNKRCNWILSSLLDGHCYLTSRQVTTLHKLFNQPSRYAKKLGRPRRRLLLCSPVLARLSLPKVFIITLA